MYCVNAPEHVMHVLLKFEWSVMCSAKDGAVLHVHSVNRLRHRVFTQCESNVPKSLRVDDHYASTMCVYMYMRICIWTILSVCYHLQVQMYMCMYMSVIYVPSARLLKGYMILFFMCTQD